MDQTLVYNRFGSFNPFGMMFALTRDLDGIGSPDQFAAAGQDPRCEDQTGTESPQLQLGRGQAGQVRLRDCKRPRPLVLRANVGDLLLVQVTNLLMDAPPDFSRGMCHQRRDGNPPRTADIGRESVRPHLSAGTQRRELHGEVACDDRSNPASPGGGGDPDAPDWPRTRGVNFVVEGLEPLPVGGAIDPACLGTGAVPPGGTFLCLYRVGQEGTHFLASRAAPAGGEGDGGSIVHGLFGAVLAERPGTRWYRSQVSAAAMQAVWAHQGPIRHARPGGPDYEGTRNGVPVLNMARVLDGAGQGDFAASRRVEIVHTDLNAIVFCDSGMAAAWGRPWPIGDGLRQPTGAAPDADRPRVQGPLGCAVPTAEALAHPDPGEYAPVSEPDLLSFREFTVFFHDELKTFYTRNFEELARFGQLAGVRDGFAINYGASGMGTMLLANRKGIGPAAACAECLYEEFFLTSWANGDPALLEWYDDDPSNVHHSYLNDPVVFRNFHAGPKETHVFHLHAHQWFSGNDPSRGSYLDSQTVGPGQGFTYNIYHGGRPGGAPGHWGGGGSGNRNRTVGDSIFHCHLYPHFAQGMWALWRVHDVFEDGTRMLPDGEAVPGLSTTIRPPGQIDARRSGSVDPVSGAWLGGPDPALGTPIPALVPLPAEPLPPLPSYPNSDESGPDGRKAQAHPAGPFRRHALVQARLRRDGGPGPERLVRTQAAPAGPPAVEEPPTGFMPGYPFYIAGQAGHRPPQAPGDIARALEDEGPIRTGDLLSGGLGRHVVTRAGRRLNIALPPDVLQADARLWQGGDGAMRRLERLRAQIVAKAAAMGDMTAHLTDAVIDMLPPGGTPLERSAMAFHHDGAGLTLYDVAGNPLGAQQAGRYPTGNAAAPGGGTSPTAAGFQVNGAPPAPGAPFADPCGVPMAEGRGTRDPFQIGADIPDFARDPALIGFRRYRGSAVQLDLVVNKAGWHDPQARINVLTARSDAYKAGNGPISPRVSDREEPFFFRALSGECIEFRHTNELPRELQLDDFQVRTPTDTIGQHIHLVKFDVTASDGSGNGWNYEDGTFAPDEVAARICAWHETGAPEAAAVADDLAARVRAVIAGKPDAGPPLPGETGFCAWRPVQDHALWRLKRGDFPFLFQTTVQRWFADPITSSYGRTADRDLTTDRTLRTVFSHDHFGPSSIQQHGFYTALLIEPASRMAGSPGNETDVCPTTPDSCTELAPDPDRVVEAGEDLVGASKILVMGDRNDPLHRDYREFALAVADFALLYDPRDRSAAPSFDSAPARPHAGLAQIACEARHAADPAQLESRCGSGLGRDNEGRWNAPGEDVPPAWIAAGLPGDYLPHRQDFAGNLFLPGDATALRDELIDYRRKAAFLHDKPDSPGLARPVAAPLRPESISVDHHDPYLVNYRMSAVPLRIGTDASRGSDCEMLAMSRPGSEEEEPSAIVRKLTAGELGRCSLDRQDRDAGLAFSSRDAGGTFDPRLDPETPILEAYQGERLMFRLIQGAQEVQHVFNVAGIPFRRNVDQIFPQGMRPLATAFEPARSACFARLRHTRPAEYDAWLQGRLDPASVPWWTAFESALARCDNAEGLTFAQEVGISEHFEMRGRLRQDVNMPEVLRRGAQILRDTPAAGAPLPGHPQISDYFYNFATLDSLWNGAWGLVRIYKDERTSAPEAADGTAIGTRLASIQDSAGRRQGQAEMRSAGGAESANAASNAVIGRSALPTCPAPLPGRMPGQSVRSSHGVVVALRVADLTGQGQGTAYGLGQRDTDGLMLALLTPEDLGDELAANPTDDWSQLDRQAVLERVRKVYGTRPEPFVMRVNAGDCVILRLVNTLRDGMPDSLGDARMPPIVPLNTDPAAQVEGSQGILRAEMAPATGIRPSALLGLTIGLPGGDQILKLPLGFGLNGQAVPPAGQDAWVSPEFSFYAGRVSVRDQAVSAVERCGPQGATLAQSMLDCAQAAFQDSLAGDLSAALEGVAGAVPLSARAAALQGIQIFSETPSHLDPGFTFVDETRSLVLERPGQWTAYVTAGGTLAADVADKARQGDHGLAAALCENGAEPCRKALDGFAAGLSRDFQTALAALGAAQVHFIPYAFGPVPVRATADPVSQMPHGLFGVIDVLPQQWPLGGERTDRVAWSLDDAPERQSAVIARVAEKLNGFAPDGRAVLQPHPGPDDRNPPTDRAFRTALGFGQPQRYAGADLLSPGAADMPRKTPAPLREFVLFYQDGLNLHDEHSRITWTLREKDGTTSSLGGLRPVPDCTVCDDSYDMGEQGVSYRSPGYVPLLRAMGATLNGQRPERGGRQGDMNAADFPADFFGIAHEAARDDPRFPLTLHACHGEQVVIRVIHPGGRARQRVFVMNGLGYDDLFPGFGFPNSALVAPAKAVSAWLTPKDLAARDKEVSFLWIDGPTTLAGGGTWGLVTLHPWGAKLPDRDGKVRSTSEVCPWPPSR